MVDSDANYLKLMAENLGKWAPTAGSPPTCPLTSSWGPAAGLCTATLLTQVKDVSRVSYEQVRGQRVQQEVRAG